MGCRQSTAVAEPTPASTSTKAVAETEVPAAAPASNTEAPAAPASTEPEAEAAAAASEEDKKFAVNGVSITEQGIVYYHVEAVDGSVSVKRRYNDFKDLYAKIDTSALPPLPEASIRAFLRGRNSQQLMKDRESKFTVIMNAIAKNPALAESEAVQKFLA